MNAPEARLAVTRIYRVDLGENSQLVRAGTPAQALRHVARNVMRVQVASQADLVELIADGVKVEEAGE